MDDGIPKKTKESIFYVVKVFEGNSVLKITLNCKQWVSTIHVLNGLWAVLGMKKVLFFYNEYITVFFLL